MPDGALLALAAGPALGADLTVTSFGGAYQDAQRKVYFEPFKQATGIDLVEDVWNGGVGAIRAKVEGGGQEWDVVQVEAEELVIGCEEGLYEPIDWDAVGGKEQFIDAAVNDCGVGAIVWSTVLAYDGDKITEDPPQSWADFLDTEKFPGKRGLRRHPKYTLEFALMADGVPPDQVYEVLRTPEGVDRAFAKLDEIKDDIIWWEAGAQPPQLLGLGRGRHDQRLQRPDLGRQQGGPELQDRLAGEHLRGRQLGDPAGHAAQGRGAASSSPSRASRSTRAICPSPSPTASPTRAPRREIDKDAAGRTADRARQPERPRSSSTPSSGSRTSSR